MNLLAIETSTEFLSLAVCRGDAVFANHVEAGQRHAEMILGSISALLGEAGLRLGDLEGIAYGEGPGSFTGLRIACGVVQGLALARGLKALGVSTLLALAEEGAADKAFVVPPDRYESWDAFSGQTSPYGDPSVRVEPGKARLLCRLP